MTASSPCRDVKLVGPMRGNPGAMASASSRNRKVRFPLIQRLTPAAYTSHLCVSSVDSGS